MTAKTGQAEHKKQTGQSWKNSQNRIAKAGFLRQEFQDRTAKQNSMDETGRTG
jgi:hypothetical protein